MALIPKGPCQGWVLALADSIVTPPLPGTAFPQRWMLIDPTLGATRTFEFMFTMLPNDGDLFCSGHTWLHDGRLFIAGGTTVYGNNNPNQNPLNPVWGGGRNCFIFDPNLISVLPGSPTTPNAAQPSNIFNKITPPLDRDRWYPTVLQVPNKHVLVLGGSHIVPTGGTPMQFQTITWDDFEVYDPLSTSSTAPAPWVDFTGYVNAMPTAPQVPQRLLRGPGTPPNVNPQPTFGVSPTPPWQPFNAGLDPYPRMWWLSGNQTFLCGMKNACAMLIYPPPTPIASNTNMWLLRDIWGRGIFPDGAPPTVGDWRRYDGSAVLYPIGPNFHSAMIIGGQLIKDGTLIISPASVTESVEMCIPTNTVGGPMPAGYDWNAIGSMPQGRVYCNAVLLPDKSVLVIGGEPVENQTPPPVLSNLLFQGTSWQPSGPLPVSPRDYHSTALLLPDARVLVGGGNDRTRDFEIFEPHYLAGGPTRPPQPLPSPTLWSMGQSASVGYGSSNSTLTKLVLVRPGSITHHFDSDQRLIELFVFEDDGIRPPVTSVKVPTNILAGYYMLFAIDTNGVPSIASWVDIQ